ncbi:MAG: hypothetical protein ACRYF5_16585 [Janthinobacterium lividum]
MTSFRNGLSPTDANGSAGKPAASTPMGQQAQAGAAQAMEFQLWVSQQATSMAKLKVFNTMAKSINDQQ